LKGEERFFPFDRALNPRRKGRTKNVGEAGVPPLQETLD
jgi:hypothetical protein